MKKKKKENNYIYSYETFIDYMNNNSYNKNKFSSYIHNLKRIYIGFEIINIQHKNNVSIIFFKYLNKIL